MKMVALKSFTYAGKRINPGDPFDAVGRSDARLLKALKRADDAPPPTPPAAEPPPPPYRSRALVADDVAAPTATAAEKPTAVAPAAKRPYKRRDTVAE